MSIPVASPEVCLLRLRIEEKLGRPVQCHNHFIGLSLQIERELHEHLSETTLERIWNYSTRQHSAVSLRTLDVLAVFAGFRGWVHFCTVQREISGKESAMFSEGLLQVDQLSLGTRLRIGWMPDRQCVIRYLGNFRFVTETVRNSSSLRPGDSFSCLQFQLHRELYMDYFTRAGEPADGRNLRYAVGGQHGLVLLEVLSPED